MKHDPIFIEFVRALARAQANRDYDERQAKGNDRADRHLRPLQQPVTE